MCDVLQTTCDVTMLLLHVILNFKLMFMQMLLTRVLHLPASNALISLPNYFRPCAELVQPIIKIKSSTLCPM